MKNAGIGIGIVAVIVAMFAAYIAFTQLMQQMSSSEETSRLIFRQLEIQEAVATLQAESVESAPTATALAQEVAMLLATKEALQRQMGDGVSESRERGSVATLNTPIPVASVLPTDTPGPTLTPTETETPTSSPTNTPIPTDTPLPTATNTPEPTDTPTQTPTLTPTPTSTPTITPTPTKTPIPDTPAGTILDVGQAWRQNGFELILKSANLADAWGHGPAIEVTFFLTNQKTSDVAIKYNLGNAVSATDNRGKSVGLGVAHAMVDRYGFSTYNKIVPAGKTIRLESWGDYKSGPSMYILAGMADLNVTEVIVTASISSITNAKWRIPVLH